MVYLLEAAAIGWLAAGMNACRLCDKRIVGPYSTIKLNGRQQQFKAGTTQQPLVGEERLPRMHVGCVLDRNRLEKSLKKTGSPASSLAGVEEKPHFATPTRAE